MPKNLLLFTHTFLCTPFQLIYDEGREDLL